jgi:hypothetical protein
VNILKKYILLLFIISSSTLFSQQPYYFTIGEKELGGAEIYSILETKDELLYVATDIGLFKYEQDKFILIESSREQIRSSLFNLIESKEGEVFCSNLSGQIFIVNDKKLVLFSELPRESLSMNTYIEFDKSGNLIALSNDCYKITKDSICLIKENKEINDLFNFGLNKLYNGKLLLYARDNDTVFSIQNSSLKYFGLTNKKNEGTRNYFILKNQLIEVFRNFYNTSFQNTSVSRNISEIYFQMNENEIWGLDKKNGVRVISIVNDTLKVTNRFFNDLFISTVNKKGKNTYLGTFGKGVLVIPNYDLYSNIIENTKDRINDIAVDNDNNVFFAKSKKGIYHYKKSATPIDENPKNSYAGVFILKDCERVGVNKSFPHLYYEAPFTVDNCNEVRYIKDVCTLGCSTLLFATSKGVLLKSSNKKQDTSNWGRYSNCSLNYFFNKAINNRCVSIAADSINNRFYVATASSVFEFQNKQRAELLQLKKTELLYLGKRFSCNELIFYKNKLWCATKNNGVLVFEHGKLVQQLNRGNGIISNSITEIRIKDNILYLTDEKQIQSLNLITNDSKVFGAEDGFSGVINDIELSHNKLWVLSDKSHVKSIQINKLKIPKDTLFLYLDSIIVSEVKINRTKNHKFNYKQNHFIFYETIRNIKYKEHATIKYRVRGLENKWNSMEVNNGKIEYKSLPPGEYTFEAFAVASNKKSKLQSFSFFILHPYWSQWWFYLIILLIVLITAFILFKIRIENIKKKNKDLIVKRTLETSLIDLELKALRSQMNPHFIFNALNSIQDLILKEETDASYDYIVLFSELVRNTLNYSNKDFIPIESELEFIAVYLKLEKLRFEEDFNYKVNYEGNKNILVPSLIVQPFIENALKHGLLHQFGEKKLTINFELSDLLICTITDNGIGRIESQKIQERQGSIHESFAIEAIGKRLEILRSQHGESIGFEVIDLYEEGKPTGTKIKLVIPFKNKY